MPLEVFIHGALCVAYSGQCLTSESLGGRSANRGQCAQACRLPYELVVDGENKDLGDVRYLLSPQDLAGYASIPELLRAGIASFKIEGRLKSPEYVANITQQYRRAIDAVVAKQTLSVSPSDREEMELSFSRGFSPGWLEGNDHKRLVPGLDSSKRGIQLGEIVELRSQEICIRPETTVALGDGLAIHSKDASGQPDEQGGRVYSLRTDQKRSLQEFGERVKTNDYSDSDPPREAERVWIGFGRGELDFSRIDVGDRVFKNDDPKLNRRLRKSFSGDKPKFQRELSLLVRAKVGEVLKLTVVDGGQIDRRLIGVAVEGDTVLDAARNRPATVEDLTEKLSRFGGTPFSLERLEVELEGRPMVPVGMLNQLRRDLVQALVHKLGERLPRTIDRSAGQRMLGEISEEFKVTDAAHQETPRLSVLCRTLDQLRSVAETEVDLLYADFHDVREYRQAVQIAHAVNKKIGLASVRMQKPSEMGLLRAMMKHEPDYVLARNLAAIEYAKNLGVGIISDFSLNVANHRSAQWIRSLGAQRVTISYDLNREQVSALCQSMPTSWMEIVLHQHMPMFHMEHCVFCSVLSPGTNKTNCGRPCDDHAVKLRDRVGAEHPLQADVACRNTLYNSTPQSGAEIAKDLLHAGVRWFRVELLEESGKDAVETCALYRKLLEGAVEAREVWSSLKAANRLGVTRGTLEAKRNPLAIL